MRKKLLRKTFGILMAGIMAVQPAAMTATTVYAEGEDGISTSSVVQGDTVLLDDATPETADDPEPTPEATEEPEATPEPTPSATPEPTEEPESTPEPTLEPATPEQASPEQASPESAAEETYTVTIDPNGGNLPAEWIKTANTTHGFDSEDETDDVEVTEEDGIIKVTTTLDSLNLMNPSPADDTEYFDSWTVTSENTDVLNKEENSIEFNMNEEEYSVRANYRPIAEESDEVDNAREYTEASRASDSSDRMASTFALKPTDSYTEIELAMEGLEFVYEDGQIQTFTAPYDGDYVITAYGANGGTGYAKYDGYGVPGRGGMTEATVTLKKGQTIYMYIGEAGGDWSTERTFGGGGGSVGLDHAWVGSDDRSLHVFGRGGGATYVSIDEFDMANAGQAAFDFTDEQKAQNDAAAAEAKKHVIMLAAGGGGAGEMGSPYSHYGLNGGGYEGGILRHHNQYYLPMEQVGQVTYDATVSGRKLTREERLEAWIYPATQTRAGYGLHYSILGELYDPNPANKDPIEYLYPEREARNWGSFFFGSNAMACTGAGGGGWFGGGTDYSFDGGGGSSYIGTSVQAPDGSTVTITDPETVSGGNIKYDSTKTSPFYVNGRVLIRLDGETPAMHVILQEAANEEGSKNNIDPTDEYGQKVTLDFGQDIANKTVTYTAIIYYNYGEIMTVTPSWNYNTILSPTPKTWNDSIAKKIDNRLSVNITNTPLGVLNPDDKYYNANYPGYWAIKSVMTITNPVNAMYDTENMTKYYFSCSATASYRILSGPKYINDISDMGGLTLEYNIALNHNGVHVYDKTNIINEQTTKTNTEIQTATKNKTWSTWQYPELTLINPNHINTILVQFSSKNFNANDSITYDTNLANQFGIEVTGNQYAWTFKTKTKNSISTENWEKFLRAIKFKTYDAASFTKDGITGGVSILWYADENLWTNNIFKDSTTGHWYSFIKTDSNITWFQARQIAKSLYNNATGNYGYLAHITSASEQSFISTLTDGYSEGWIGASRKIDPANPFNWYWVDGPVEETKEPFMYQYPDQRNGVLYWGFENFYKPFFDHADIGYGEEYVAHLTGNAQATQGVPVNMWNDYSPSTPMHAMMVEWDPGTPKSGISDTDIIGTSVTVPENGTYTPPANISGMIFVENDNNGSYDRTTEKTIETITVTLKNNTGATVATTQTGSHGEYSFADITPGQYKVSFNIPQDRIPTEFEAATKHPLSNNDNETLSFVNDDFTTDLFTVAAGKSVTGANCGIYVPGKISGFVWDDTNRNGLYDNGEKKLQGLTVGLYLDGELANNGHGQQITTVTTDKNGAYTFTDIPSSLTPYEVNIMGNNSVYIGNASVSPIPETDDLSIANAASPMTYGDVSAQTKLDKAVIANIYMRTLNDDLAGVMYPYENCGLFIRQNIYGYVFGETDHNGIYTKPGDDPNTEYTDAPMAGLQVNLLDENGELVTKTFSGKSGYYEFQDVDAGKYTIQVIRADGFDANGKISADSIGLTPFLPTQEVTSSDIVIGNNTHGVYDEDNNLTELITDEFKITTKTVANSKETDDDNLMINAGMFIPSQESGLVWEDYNQDGIRQDDEELLNDVSVELLKIGDTNHNSISDYEQMTFDGKPVKIQTGQRFNYYTGEITDYEEGKYSFDNLPSGTYAVQFSSGDYDIRFYLGSPRNAGGNDTIDNDATAVYSENEEELLSSYIINVQLPGESKLTSYNYNNTYNDFGAYQKLRDVTVTKQIRFSDIEYSFGNPTFLITVYGTDQKGIYHQFTHSYEFTKEFVNDNIDDNGMVTMTYTFEGIPYARIYNIKEEANSRYALESITPVTDNVTISNNIASMNLQYDVSGEVNFLNKIIDYSGGGDAGCVVNHLNGIGHKEDE